MPASVGDSKRFASPSMWQPSRTHSRGAPTMPDTAGRSERLPILQELRSELIAVALEQEAGRDAASPLRSWLSRRMNATVMAAAFVLAGGAIAVAATGLLNGRPVKRQGPATPNAGIGVPAPGGSRLLALRVADPQGGLPWGMRLVHTTRGEVCDADRAPRRWAARPARYRRRIPGRRALSPAHPAILPETSDSGDVTCNIATAPIRIGIWPAGDRNAAPNGPKKPTSSRRPTICDRSAIGACSDHTP